MILCRSAGWIPPYTDTCTRLSRLHTFVHSYIPWHDMVSFCRVKPSLHWHVYTPIPSTHVCSQLHTLTWYGVVLQCEALPTLTRVHAYPVHTGVFTVRYLDVIWSRSAGWSLPYTDMCTRLSRPHTFVHSYIPWHDTVSFCRVKPSRHWHVYTPIPSTHVCSQLHTLTWYGVVLQGEALPTLTRVHAYPVHTRLFTVTYLDMTLCRSAGWSPPYTDTCTRLSRPHRSAHSYGHVHIRRCLKSYFIQSNLKVQRSNKRTIIWQRTWKTQKHKIWQDLSIITLSKTRHYHV